LLNWYGGWSCVVRLAENTLNKHSRRTVLFLLWLDRARRVRVNIEHAVHDSAESNALSISEWYYNQCAIWTSIWNIRR
jgi:hypothetical protein